MCLSRHFYDPIGDAVRSRFDGIVGEVSVAGGGLHLGMAEHHTYLVDRALSRLSWTCL